jgi:hypothetical protein
VWHHIGGNPRGRLTRQKDGAVFMAGRRLFDKVDDRWKDELSEETISAIQKNTDIMKIFCKMKRLAISPGGFFHHGSK